MPIVLGIDGGGSSTRAVLASDSGDVLGHGAGGPSNLLSVGREQTAASLEEAVGLAWADSGLDRREADVAVLGLAGLTLPQHRNVISVLAAELGLASAVRVEHDLHIALAGGLAGDPGIVLVAGTGAACFARSKMGKTALVGGKGALAGDSGSAYWVAHRAVRIAVKQLDGRLPESELCQTVLSFLGVAREGDFVSKLRALTTPEIARLCPLVVRLGIDGDDAARQIVAGAEAALADMARTAARQADLSEPKLILTGGLARSLGFRPGLEAAVAAGLPGVTFPGRTLSPVGGAVLEALRELGAPIDRDTLKRLESLTVR